VIERTEKVVKGGCVDNSKEGMESVLIRAKGDGNASSGLETTRNWEMKRIQRGNVKSKVALQKNEYINIFLNKGVYQWIWTLIK
jgi:hypothetical protein